jgi:hypothetical protein
LTENLNFVFLKQRETGESILLLWKYKESKEVETATATKTSAFASQSKGSFRDAAKGAGLCNTPTRRKAKVIKSLLKQWESKKVQNGPQKI